MNNLYLSDIAIKALNDAIEIIRKIHPGSQMRLEIYQDPESGKLEIGMLEVSGITMSDCEAIGSKLWKDINRRTEDLHIVTDVWWKE